MNLDSAIHRQVTEIAQDAESLFDQAQYVNAVEHYLSAIQLLPEPKSQWEAYTWLAVGIVDALFLSGKFLESIEWCEHLYRVESPGALQNPFLRLRAGQNYFEIGDVEKSRASLIGAYMLEGSEIFDADDQKYLNSIDDLISNES